MLGIGLLILSLGHTPLPQADFHNIRHHDGPGEICRFHEHLLQWHPNAALADDVAVLHWHWILPAPGWPGGDACGDSAGLHAQVPDWSALAWNGAPQLLPEGSIRLANRPELEPLAPFAPQLHVHSAALLARSGPSASHAFSATFAPRIPIASLLSRWVC
jgi:hypothetical protein